MTDPYSPIIFQYGPPLVLACICVWLLGGEKILTWKKREDGTPVSHLAGSSNPSPDLTLKVYVEEILGTASWISSTPGQADRLLDLLSKIPQDAALSRLTVWGRKSMGGVFTMVGIENNLEPIPPSYWSNHVIDEIQFLEDRRGRTRTTLYDTSDSYEDLHLSRTQLKPSQDGRISLQAAAAELYGEISETKFGKTTADHCASEQEIWDAMGSLLINRGEAWGRRPGAAQPIKLSAANKRYNAVIGGAKMLRDRSAAKKTNFTDLSITRNQLDRIKEVVKAHADEWDAS
jgi:hypothetical protein